MESLNIVVSALEFAAKKHRDQRRKDHAASPYINHPISLIHILVNEAGVSDSIVLASALLHDTVEDTDTTLEEITQHFGQKISDIVMEVTDDQNLSRSERKALQIKHAPHLSTEAGLVKIADKISNLRDLYIAPPLNWSRERKKDYCEWAVQVVYNIKNPHPRLLALFEETVQNFKNQT